MSRAFVRDDADTERVMVPARAPLPEGVTNFVTPSGLAALAEEVAALKAEREALLALGDAPGDASRRLAALREHLDEAEARWASAVVVEPPPVDDGVVRVGATVTLDQEGEPVTFMVTGVDEADPLEGRVAFTAPIAAAILGCRVGDVVPAEVAGRRVSLRVDRVMQALQHARQTNL